MNPTLTLPAREQGTGLWTIFPPPRERGRGQGGGVLLFGLTQVLGVQGEGKYQRLKYILVFICQAQFYIRDLLG